MIGADDPVGRVIIPLGGLADQLIQDEMFYLQPMAGIGEGHEAAIDVWDVIGKDMGLGAIQLKLQLDLSSIGDPDRGFSPEVAPTPELPEFNMNALYGNLFLALDCIYPILGVVTAIVGIITWENVAVTWIWLGILIGLTYAPGYIPSAFHLLLLQTLFLNRVDQIRQESEALSSRQQERNAKAGQGSSGQQGEEEEVAKATTLGWIGTVTNILPIPTSTIKTLRGLQAKLGSTAAKISGFYDLWLWTNQGATMGLAGGDRCLYAAPPPRCLLLLEHCLCRALVRLLCDNEAFPTASRGHSRPRLLSNRLALVERCGPRCYRWGL